jgi:hypothetical protein
MKVWPAAGLFPYLTDAAAFVAAGCAATGTARESERSVSTIRRFIDDLHPSERVESVIETTKRSVVKFMSGQDSLARLQLNHLGGRF